MSSCTSCKYCILLGRDDDGIPVKRRCSHASKSYEDYIEYDCPYYTYASSSAPACTTCDYCTEIGSDNDGNAIKRRCTHPNKKHEDYVEYDCQYHTTAASSSSSYTPSAESETPKKKNGFVKFLVAIIVLLVIALVAFWGMHFLGITDNNASNSAFGHEQNNAQSKDENSDSDSIGITNVNSSDESNPAFTLSPCGTATVTPSVGLNLRVGPSTSYRRILVMSYQKTVTVYYITNGWAYVDFEGTKGWCSCEWLDLSKVNFTSQSTSVSETYYVHNESGLELLLGTADNAPIILYIANATKITLLHRQGDWAYVDYNGYTGWCLLVHLTTEVPKHEAAVYLNEDATVSFSGGLTLYSSDSESSKAVTHIDNGATIILLLIDGDWAYVDYNGYKGWCSVVYLVRGEEPTTQNQSDIDSAINKAVADSKAFAETFKGKPLNGRRTITKDEVVDFYLEVDEFCKNSLFYPPSIFDYQHEWIQPENYVACVRVTDDEFKTFADVCEKYYSYLGDDIAQSYMHCFEYNGSIYSEDGAVGAGVLGEVRRNYNVKEENGGFTICIVSETLNWEAPYNVVSTEEYSMRLEKEDGVWVFTDYTIKF